eukprot:Em0018g188a
MARLSILFLLGLVLTPLMHFTGPMLAVAEDGEQDLEVADEEEREEREEEPVHMPDPVEKEDVQTTGTEEAEEEEEEIQQLRAAPNATTTVVFTNRPSNEFYAGEVVTSLIGFTNKGSAVFIVTGIEASFRYPQDFSYHIQNFSMIPLQSYIPPNTQASLCTTSGPDQDDRQYRDAVFNATVNIIEREEGFDAETFFMYVFMISGLSLLMFILHYVYTTVRKGGRQSSGRKPIEKGTKKDDGVDLSWLPEGTIPGPKKSPRASPRNKSTKK